LPGASLGKVDPPSLFPLLLDLAGLPAVAGPSAPAAIPPVATPGRFTSHPDPAADALVRSQLATITDAIIARVGQPEAIVLTGSFGRGEGGVFRDGDGCYRPVNDFDLLVIGPRDLRDALKQLSQELPGPLGIDYVDIGWSDGRWGNLPLTVSHFDLKYGSQMLAGDANILERLPDYASADLPIYEAVKLLLNRSAGLLTGLRGAFLAGAAPDAAQRRYLANQIAKAWMAIGDWHLIRWQGYDASYRRRGVRFAALAPGAGIPAAVTRPVTQAYQFKCQPDYALFAQSLEEIQKLRPHLELSLVHAVNLMAEGYARNLPDAMTLYLRTMSADTAWVEADNIRCRSVPEARSWLQPETPDGVSLRHLVCSVLPFLNVAALDPARAGCAIGEVLTRLQPAFRLPAVSGGDPTAWETLRAFVVQAWFALCH
jgi:hypothetical protein